LAIAAIAASGCAAGVAPPPPTPPPPAPVQQVVEQPHNDEWNVFPDPLTGHVEVYHNGEDVGSVTGDEKEDPPEPKPHKEDEIDQAP
jgi:hypothetical protein